MAILAEKSVANNVIFMLLLSVKGGSMESYIINGQNITSASTVAEGNQLIMRKGRATLLSAKVMLFALLNVEDRVNKQYAPKELQFYKQLAKSTGVDYSKGIVSEIAIGELRRVLQKERSGSFYSSLRDLFSIDPHEPKSLRNSWAVMMPDADSGVLGYAEFIISTHIYKSKIFIKFNEEQRIRDQIFKDKEKCTELPFLYMQQQCRSIHSFRLFEILWYQISKADAEMRANGANSYYDTYSFRFSLGELQLMLGILDLTIDKDAKRLVSSSANPDYNQIAALCNQKQSENMFDYRAFRKYSLDVAVNEINSNPTSAITVEYDVEREEHSNKISAISFQVTKRDAYVEGKIMQEEDENIILTPKPKNMADLVVAIARELCQLSLSYEELCKIADIADYDMEIVKASYFLYRNPPKNEGPRNEGFLEWFIKFRQ